MQMNLDHDDIIGFLNIKKLPESAYDELISALNKAVQVSTLIDVEQHLLSKLKSVVKPEALRSILHSLGMAYQVREFSGVRKEQFLEDLLASLASSGNAEFSVAQEKLKKLRIRLNTLLSIESLKAIAKAGRLMRDGERLYCNAKILTDIRPVFKDDASERPLGAVITHDLKIAYHCGKDHKEFHIILDADDLELLESLIQRARTKERTLSSLVKEMKIRNFGA